MPRSIFSKYYFLGVNLKNKNKCFFRKNLKIKKAYLGGFSAKNEKYECVFGKKIESLVNESVLSFFLGDLE